LDVFIDGFTKFFLSPYIICDHLKCVSRLRATMYKVMTETLGAIGHVFVFAARTNYFTRP